MSWDHTNKNIVVIVKNTEMSLGVLRRLSVTQTPVKDYQLTPMWKATTTTNNEGFKHLKDISFHNNIPKIEHGKVAVINEKDMLKNNNLNIDNGIFRGDSLSPFLFCIVVISLPINFRFFFVLL